MEVAVVDGYSETMSGAQRSMLAIAEAGQTHGWTVTGVLPAEGASAEWLRGHGLRVETLGVDGALLRTGGTWRRHLIAITFALPRLWWAMARAIRSADIVHVNDLRALIMVGPWCILRARRLVWHVHAAQHGARVASLAARGLRLLRVPIIVASRRDGDSWSHGQAGAFIEIPYPISPRPRSTEGPVPRIVCVGRSHPDKGLDVLLEAVALSKQEVPDVCVDIVASAHPGHEAHRALLVSAASTISGAALVEPVPDTTPVVEGAWLYAQPSRHEPFGIAVLEAAMQGVPAVAARVGGLQDIVLDGETGVLVPPDDADALHTALVQLLQDEATRARMGAAAREHATLRFSPEAFGSALAEVYARRRR